MENLKLDVLWLRQSDGSDGPSIEEHTVNVRICFCCLGEEFVDPFEVTDIELDSSSSRASVFLHERIDSILSSTDNDDFGALLNEAVSQGSTDA